MTLRATRQKNIRFEMTGDDSHIAHLAFLVFFFTPLFYLQFSLVLFR